MYTFGVCRWVSVSCFWYVLSVDDLHSTYLVIMLDVSRSVYTESFLENTRENSLRTSSPKCIQPSDMKLEVVWTKFVTEYGPSIRSLMRA